MVDAPQARRLPGVARAIDRLLPGECHARRILHAAAQPPFEASGLNRIGQSYDEIRCEAYFYDALLQAVTGDAATRSARFAKGIQEVLETRAGHYYEHLMARYLRSRGNRQGG